MKLGVVGAGLIGQLRAQTVHESDRATLAGVMDPVRENAERAAAGSDAIVTSELDELLSLGLDAVLISSPTHMHEEAGVACLEAGSHVLCEKPLAPSVKACRRMVATARRMERNLAVGFNHRYYPSIQYVKRVLDAGKLGTLDHFRVFGGHDGLANFRGEWQYKGPEAGGGAMMDVGSHMADLTRFLAGEIVQVFGVESNSVWEVEGSEDNAVAVFRTDTGVPVSFQATWNEWKGYRFYVEAYGSHGMVRGYYAPMSNLLVTQREPGGTRRTRRRHYPGIRLREKLMTWKSTTRNTFVEELRDFFALIDGDDDVDLATGLDGVRAVEIAAAVRESSRTGRSLALDASLTD